MEAPQWFFTKALSHRQKVLRLYKRALHEMDAWYLPDQLEARFQKVLMRARFDQYAQEKDMRKAKLLLADGVRELWEKKHPMPLTYANDPYGVATEREPRPPDIFFDAHWTEHDRDRYPKYFERREQRKRELLESWQTIMAEREAKTREDTGMNNRTAK